MIFFLKTAEKYYIKKHLIVTETMTLIFFQLNQRIKFQSRRVEISQSVQKQHDDFEK